MAPRQNRNIVEENEILQVSKYELENWMITILSPVASGWERCCRKISREMILNLSWRTGQSFAGWWTKFSPIASRSFEKRWYNCLLELENNLREVYPVCCRGRPSCWWRTSRPSWPRPRGTESPPRSSSRPRTCSSAATSRRWGYILLQGEIYSSWLAGGGVPLLPGPPDPAAPWVHRTKDRYILLNTEFLNFDIDTVMKIQYLETLW